MTPEQKSLIKKMIETPAPTHALSREEQEFFISQLLTFIKDSEYLRYAISIASPVPFVVSYLEKMIIELDASRLMLIHQINSIIRDLLYNLGDEIGQDICDQHYVNELVHLGIFCGKRTTKDQLESHFEYCKLLLLDDQNDVFVQNYLKQISLVFKKEIMKAFVDHPNLLTTLFNHEQRMRPHGKNIYDDTMFNDENLILIKSLVENNNKKEAFEVIDFVISHIQSPCEDDDLLAASYFNLNKLQFHQINDMYSCLIFTLYDGQQVKYDLINSEIILFILQLNNAIIHLLSKQAENNQADTYKDKMRTLAKILSRCTDESDLIFISMYCEALELKINLDQSFAEEFNKNKAGNRKCMLTTWSAPKKEIQQANTNHIDVHQLRQLLHHSRSNSKIHNRDIFFTAVASAMNAIKKSESEYNVFSLRMACYFHLQNSIKGNPWIKKVLKASKTNFNDYLSNIMTLTEDLTQSVLADKFPNTQIEGRILCQEFKIKIHVILIGFSSEDSVDHILIDDKNYVPVAGENISYDDHDMIHLVSENEHYVAPIFLQPKAKITNKMI